MKKLELCKICWKMTRHTTETCPVRKELKPFYKDRIWQLMDEFLTEGDKPRRLEQLNQDRKLFVEEMNELIDQILDKAFIRWKEQLDEKYF